MKKTYKILLVCLALVMCLGAVACSASENNMSDSIGDAEGSSQIVNGELDRKIVYDVYLDIETNDVKKLRDDFAKKCDSFGGYVEFNDESYDEGKLVSVHVNYRIPTEQLDSFIDSIEGQGTVEKKNVSLKDITTSYVNASASKSALEERKVQLEKILEDENVSTSDRIMIINEISSVNTQLMEIQLLIDRYDSMVDYSTVEVYIGEETTFWDVFIPIMIFFALPIGVPAIVIFFVLKQIKRK